MSSNTRITQPKQISLTSDEAQYTQTATTPTNNPITVLMIPFCAALSLSSGCVEQSH